MACNLWLVARSALLSCAAPMGPALMGSARAGSMIVTNETAVTAFQGNEPTAYFQGPNPYVAQGSIGPEFQTSSLTVQTSQQGGLVVLDLSYMTRFSGSELLSGAVVQNADIFLSNASGYGAQSFGYAIALGDQAQKAHLATRYKMAGLLPVSTASPVT
jgi:hypothetical protein